MYPYLSHSVRVCARVPARGSISNGSAEHRADVSGLGSVYFFHERQIPQAYILARTSKVINSAYKNVWKLTKCSKKDEY